MMTSAWWEGRWSVDALTQLRGPCGLCPGSSGGPHGGFCLSALDLIVEEWFLHCLCVFLLFFLPLTWRGFGLRRNKAKSFIIWNIDLESLFLSMPFQRPQTQIKQLQNRTKHCPRLSSQAVCVKCVYSCLSLPPIFGLYSWSYTWLLFWILHFHCYYEHLSLHTIFLEKRFILSYMNAPYLV